MNKFKATFVVLIAFAACMLPTTADAVTKVKLLEFGDSLTREAEPTITAAFKTNPSYSISVHGQIGMAPCDFLLGITTALDSAANYRLLVLQTAGNSQSPCMREPGQCARCYMPIGSPEWAAKYRTDLNAIVALAESKGTAVLFVSTPPVAGVASNRVAVYNTVEPHLALDHPLVVFTDDARFSVAKPDGSFTATRPCLPGETAAVGCVAGRIPVRAPDGLHFCPTGFAIPCPEYSSGAFRFGTAIAISTAADLP